MISYLVLERDLQGFGTPEGTIWILECGSIMHLGYTITLIIAKTKEVIQKVIRMRVAFDHMILMCIAHSISIPSNHKCKSFHGKNITFCGGKRSRFMLYNKQGITQLPPKTIICHLKLGH